MLKTNVTRLRDCSKKENNVILQYNETLSIHTLRKINIWLLGDWNWENSMEKTVYSERGSFLLSEKMDVVQLYHQRNEYIAFFPLQPLFSLHSLLRSPRNFSPQVFFSLVCSLGCLSFSPFTQFLFQMFFYPRVSNIETPTQTHVFTCVSGQENFSSATNKVS